MFQFDQSGLTFADRSFYLDQAMAKKYYKAFREYFAAVTVLMGADNETAFQVADDIWNLETKLAEVRKNLIPKTILKYELNFVWIKISIRFPCI